MYERLFWKPRREVREAAYAIGRDALAPPSPVSEGEKATIATRKRESGRVVKAVSLVPPLKRTMHARDAVANGGPSRQDEEGDAVGRGRSERMSVRPVIPSRYDRNQDPGVTPVLRPAMGRRETFAAVVNRSRAREETTANARSRTSRSGAREASSHDALAGSGETPGGLPMTAELESALQLVEQYLPRLMPLMRGRGRGRPVGSRGGRGARGGRGRGTFARGGTAYEDAY